MPTWAKRVLWAAVVVAFLIALVVGLTDHRSFADDMNHACRNHHGVFSFNAEQGGGVCRDGTAVAP